MGIIAIPEVDDLLVVKHIQGLFLFDSRRIKCYNLNLIAPEQVNLEKGYDLNQAWPFSEHIQIVKDSITKKVILLEIIGSHKNIRLAKIDISDIINAVKLLRLEE